MISVYLLRRSFLNGIKHLLVMRKHQQLPVTCNKIENVVSSGGSLCTSSIVKVFKESSATVYSLRDTQNEAESQKNLRVRKN